MQIRNVKIENLLPTYKKIRKLTNFETKSNHKTKPIKAIKCQREVWNIGNA